MKRFDCLTLLSPMLDDDLVITTLSSTKAEWAVISGEDRGGNLFMGSMGNVSAVGLGMALSLPHRRVVVLESDGSVLMDLSCLTVIATYQPKNLTILVFDNEMYSGTRISLPTATAFRTSIEGMAKGAGIENARTVRDIESFEREARLGLTTDGPHYVVAKIEENTETRAFRPRLNMDHLENRYRFMRYLEKTEGKQILQSER